MILVKICISQMFGNNKLTEAKNVTGLAPKIFALRFKMLGVPQICRRNLSGSVCFVCQKISQIFPLAKCLDVGVASAIFDILSVSEQGNICKYAVLLHGFSIILPYQKYNCVSSAPVSLANVVRISVGVRAPQILNGSIPFS